MNTTEKLIKKQAGLVNAFIYKYLDEGLKNKEILKAGRYAISSGGHRYRSILSLEIYKLLGGKTENFVKAFVGIEYIHHASLIFDDLPCMDNSPMRRGKKTLHLVFSESTAILTALYLLEKGKSLIYENASRYLKGESLNEFQRLLSKSIVRLLSGQEVDLRKEKTKSELLSMMQDKNSVFYLACVTPSYFMQKKFLKDFDYVGKQISLAYQYLDDLRDLEPIRVTGKPKAQDVGKLTFLAERGEQEVHRKINKIKTVLVRRLSKIKKQNTVIGLVQLILGSH